MAEVILNQEELARSTETFRKYSRNASSTINMWELRSCLNDLGKSTNEESFFKLIEHISDNGTGTVTLSNFLAIVSALKGVDTPDDDFATLESFTACGGNPDKTGHVNVDVLRSVVQDYGLAIDIDGLVSKFDEESTGKLEYDEFALLLTERTQ
ncbi:hypothetical protein PCE1_004840 [Barthelona sp. PCE]